MPIMCVHQSYWPLWGSGGGHYGRPAASRQRVCRVLHMANNTRQIDVGKEVLCHVVCSTRQINFEGIKKTAACGATAGTTVRRRRHHYPASPLGGVVAAAVVVPAIAAWRSRRHRRALGPHHRRRGPGRRRCTRGEGASWSAAAPEGRDGRRWWSLLARSAGRDES